MSSAKQASNRKRGSDAEDLACAYLEGKDYTILDRNYFFEHAEVDIVAHTDFFIVFVEVKSRKNHDFGRPEEAVTEKKQQLIAKAAEAWLHERKMTGSPVRFDVIAITQPGGQAPDIQHYRNAFIPGT